MESIIWHILFDHNTDTKQLLCDINKEKRRKRERDDDDNDRDENNVKKPNLNLVEDETTNKISTDTPNTSCTNEQTEPVIDKEKLLQELENEKQFTNEEIHEKLKAIDPVAASRLHPNNRRKIIR